METVVESLESVGEEEVVEEILEMARELLSRPDKAILVSSKKKCD